ncbi:MAG: 4-hydroxythreonine-4-phosphate dehydrogenase PdxA [Pseudomonadota bacterium]
MIDDDISRLPLAVSIGEPGGIGPDILLQSVADARAGTIPPLPALVVYGDPEQLAARAAHLGLDVAIGADDVTQAAGAPGALTVHPLINTMQDMPGVCLEANAPGVIEAIEASVAAIKHGSARGLITLPINKKSLYSAGFAHPGHTEFLGALAQHHWPGAAVHVPEMMLAGPDLKTVPVTIHIPLADVPQALTFERIVACGRTVADALTRQFGVDAPRLAIAGLNPHAGEEGSMGSEDEAIVRPAVETLRAEGINAIGPLPADTMFHGRARAGYDVALCMYHDQALIPAKTLAFDDAVNVTLGLPFVRTSPDHGTALDLAGTGRANPSSFLAALRMADDMTARSTQRAAA